MMMTLVVTDVQTHFLPRWLNAFCDQEHTHTHRVTELMTITMRVMTDALPGSIGQGTKNEFTGWCSVTVMVLLSQRKSQESQHQVTANVPQSTTGIFMAVYSQFKKVKPA